MFHVNKYKKLKRTKTSFEVCMVVKILFRVVMSCSVVVGYQYFHRSLVPPLLLNANTCVPFPVPFTSP